MEKRNQRYLSHMQANFPGTIKFYFLYSLTTALNPPRIQKSWYNISKKMKVVADHNLPFEQPRRRSAHIKYPQPVCMHTRTFPRRAYGKYRLQGCTLSSFCITITKMLICANEILMLKWSPPRLTTKLSMKPGLHFLFKKQTVNLIYSFNIYLAKPSFLSMLLTPWRGPSEKLQTLSLPHGV